MSTTSQSRKSGLLRIQFEMVLLLSDTWGYRQCKIFWKDFWWHFFQELPKPGFRHDPQWNILLTKSETSQSGVAKAGICVRPCLVRNFCVNHGCSSVSRISLQSKVLNLQSLALKWKSVPTENSHDLNIVKYVLKIFLRKALRKGKRIPNFLWVQIVSCITRFHIWIADKFCCWSRNQFNDSLLCAHCLQYISSIDRSLPLKSSNSAINKFIIQSWRNRSSGWEFPTWPWQSQ